MLNSLTGPDQPTREDLDQVLGSSLAQWEALLEATPALTPSWKRYTGAHGWQLRLLRKKRNMVYLVPGQGDFLLGAALNPRGLALAMSSEVLPQVLKDSIEAERAYREGKAARVRVSDQATLEQALEIVRIKVESVAT